MVFFFFLLYVNFRCISFICRLFFNTTDRNYIFSAQIAQFYKFLIFYKQRVHKKKKNADFFQEFLYFTWVVVILVSSLLLLLHWPDFHFKSWQNFLILFSIFHFFFLRIPWKWKGEKMLLTEHCKSRWQTTKESPSIHYYHHPLFM